MTHNSFSSVQEPIWLCTFTPPITPTSVKAPGKRDYADDHPTPQIVAIKAASRDLAASALKNIIRTLGYDPSQVAKDSVELLELSYVLKNHGYITNKPEWVCVDKKDLGAVDVDDKKEEQEKTEIHEVVPKVNGSGTVNPNVAVKHADIPSTSSTCIFPPSLGVIFTATSNEPPSETTTALIPIVGDDGIYLGTPCVNVEVADVEDDLAEDVENDSEHTWPAPPASGPLTAYQMAVDELREKRRRAYDGRPEDERICLEQLEDLYDQLNSEERLTVNGQGWRSWPDLYDQRIKTKELVDLDDEDENETEDGYNAGAEWTSKTCECGCNNTDKENKEQENYQDAMEDPYAKEKQPALVEPLPNPNCPKCGRHDYMLHGHCPTCTPSDTCIEWPCPASERVLFDPDNTLPDGPVAKMIKEMLPGIQTFVEQEARRTLANWKNNELASSLKDWTRSEIFTVLGPEQYRFVTGSLPFVQSQLRHPRWPRY